MLSTSIQYCLGECTYANAAALAAKHEEQHDELHPRPPRIALLTCNWNRQNFTPAAFAATTGKGIF
jgi:hypothetical protein